MIADKFASPMRAALVAAVFAGLILPAQAQKPPAKKTSLAAFALAMEVITLKGADKMFVPLVPGIVSNVKNTLLQNNLNLSAQLNEVAIKIAREYNPRIGELNRYAAQLFATYFTEKELLQIIAFYKSPVGKKVIAAEPVVLDKSMANANEWAKKMEQEILQRFRAEMKKKGHNL